ncbi:hypothetical protein Tco_1365350 [Tanacetum coccineum]
MQLTSWSCRAAKPCAWQQSSRALCQAAMPPARRHNARRNVQSSLFVGIKILLEVTADKRKDKDRRKDKD